LFGFIGHLYDYRSLAKSFLCYFNGEGYRATISIKRNGSLIPEIVTEFIAKHIHSMDVLEILLFFRKEPRKEWTALAVSKALMLERSSVQARLDYLLSAGLLNVETVDSERRYRYRAANKEMGEAADELARWYGSHRVSIISLVFSNPSEQVWTCPDNRTDHHKSNK